MTPSRITHDTGSQTESAKLYPLGDSAVVAQFGETICPEAHEKVRALAARLEAEPFAGLVEVVPAYTTLTVFCDPCELGYEKALTHLQGALTDLPLPVEEDLPSIEIPVVYGEEWGPDLAEVARMNGLTEEEVIRIHSEAEYRVYLIGFSPGFPYLGGMNERIATPRRETPRLSVPAGSVGIAGGQTGIYSVETPGGWRIIGRTPLPLFKPEDDPPALLRAGDRVRFRPIPAEEFLELMGRSPERPR